MRRTDLSKATGIVPTGSGEVLASAQAAHVLDEERVTGLELRRVCDWRTGEPLPFFQWIAQETLPPWSTATRGGKQSKQCAACGRDGHFDLSRDPLHIVYDRRSVDPASLPEVVATWEVFGRSGRPPHVECGEVYPSQPLLLVKPRVREVLKRAGVRHLIYEPVGFVDGHL